MKREKGVRHHWEITLGTETFQEKYKGGILWYLKHDFRVPPLHPTLHKSSFESWLNDIKDGNTENVPDWLRENVKFVESKSFKCDDFGKIVYEPNQAIIIPGYTLHFCSYKCACDYGLGCYRLSVKDALDL
jgi:hypothetical protein